MRAYRLTTQAEKDFLQIVDYFAAENPAVAARFIDAVENSCNLLTEYPEIGRTVDFIHHQGVRRFHIKGFQQYALFYHLLEQEIEVIRMCHGARDLPALFQV